MNYIKKNYFFSFFCIMLYFVMASCSNEEPNQSPADLRIDALIYYQGQMEELLATETDSESGYPEDSYTNLKAAKKELDDAVEKAQDGTFRIQDDVDTAADAAEAAINAFLASKVFITKNCELFVPGSTDASNYIEFDTANVYNQRVLSLEFWFKGVTKTNSQRQGAIFSCLIHRGGNDFDGWNVNLWASDEDGNGPYKIRATRGFHDLAADGDHLIEPGADNYDVLNWHHIVSVYDETLSTNQMKLYVDGTLVASATDPSWTVGLERYRPSDIKLCAFKTLSDPNNHMAISGSIKKVRFWGKALSESEIMSLKNSEVTGTETDLIAAWDFTQTVENPNSIIDKTGKHTAKVFGGDVEWITQ